MQFDIKKLIHDYHIINISSDSRKINKGDLFFAINGFNYDGNNYIPEAFQKGAKLVISDKITFSPYGQVLKVLDVRETLAEFASVLYPHIPKYLVGVIGTNGKTSVVSYFQQILTSLDYKSATIGTLGTKTHFRQDNQLENNTTPDILELRNTFTKLKGIDYIAVEISSHAISQKRIHKVPFYAIAFSSFSQDHLDYHKNIKNYLNTKLSLLKNNLTKESKIILNKQVKLLPEVTDYIKFIKNTITTVGINADVNIKKIKGDINQQFVKFIYKGKDYNFRTSILGKFQVINILLASILVESCEIQFDKIVSVLNELNGVEGRLELIFSKNFYIFIDYAHTPDALRKVLIELNSIKNIGARIITLFGCGGDRDKKKRQIMGKIASQLSDIVIITDDNPRNEDPSLIRKDIISGIDNKNCIEIADRYDAIKYSINNVKNNDILLIAGKGHELYQEIQGKKIPFYEKEIIYSLLNKSL